MIESAGAYKDKQIPRSWELTETPMYLVIDLFCGAGGVTTGFAEAQLNGNSFVKVIACINHDHKAIKSHWANHPEVIHFEEDIRTLELSGLVETVDYWRSVYPNALVILWGSLECTKTEHRTNKLNLSAIQWCHKWLNHGLKQWRLKNILINHS